MVEDFENSPGSMFLAGIVCIGLGYLGAKPAEGDYVTAARILTFFYFAFFVILPFLPWFEKTRPVPATIADAVLAKNGGSAAAAAGAAAHSKS